jgi:hypothetical protein
MRWTPLCSNNHKQRKYDMSSPTNMTWALLQIWHEPSYKHDMSPPTNMTWALLQIWHEPCYKYDMSPPTNMTSALLQIWHEPCYKYEESSCHICVVCDYLSIVVSNAYCVVFLLCFSSSCVPYVASFFGLSILWLPPLGYSLTFIKLSNIQQKMGPFVNITYCYLTQLEY